MPDALTNTGHAVLEYELAVPGNPAINLSAGIVSHDHSLLIDTVYGLCAYSHRLRTRTIDFVDKKIKSAMGDGTAVFNCRLGVGTPSSMFWLPWQEHIVTHYSAVLESGSDQAGHTLELETQDFQYLMTRGRHVASHKGRVSAIVDGIASGFDFTDNVIEKTQGDGIYVQSFQDDAEFIRTRMIRRAQNEKGRGNYLFYFRDNTLHFHSPDYQSDLHNVVYYQANSVALTQMDASQKLIDMGISGTKVIVYDPITGKTKVASSDPNKALRLSDSIYDLSKIGADLQIPYHQSQSFSEEPDVIGQNVYEHARSSTFNLTLEVDNLIRLRHGDFVNLLIAPSDKQASPWSGLYLITQVRHIVQKGAVRSYYSLSRGEIRKSLSNLTTVNDQNVIVIEQDAPGQPLNVSELQSSQLTKGAGQIAAAGKLYTTVQSPG